MVVNGPEDNQARCTSPRASVGHDSSTEYQNRGGEPAASGRRLGVVIMIHTIGHGRSCRTQTGSSVWQFGASMWRDRLP